MAFKDNMRLEQIYYANLKTLIEELRRWKDGEENSGVVSTLLESCIQGNSAIILLYKNLGEEWNELTALLQKTNKDLVDLKDLVEEYKDEINEKIDEVNNYLLALIRDLEQRMDAVEADLAQMGRVLTYDISRVNDSWVLKEQNTAVTFLQTVSYFTHERPHLVLVRGELNGEVTYLFPREYELNNSTGIFEWYAMGFVGNEIHEVTVTLLPDNSVNVAVQSTDFATINQRLATAEQDIDNLEGRMDTAEDDIDALEGRMTTAEGDIDSLEGRMTTAEGDIDGLEQRMTTAESDIDTLEQTAENHNDRLTDLETCCDDMNDNVIPQLQQDIAGKQDELVAGSGITIDPVTNEISASGGDTFPLYDSSKTKNIRTLSNVNFGSPTTESETNLDKYNYRSASENVDLSNVDTECDFLRVEIGQSGRRTTLAASDTTQGLIYEQQDNINAQLKFDKLDNPSLTYSFEIPLSKIGIKIDSYLYNGAASFSFLIPCKALTQNGYKLTRVSMTRNMCAVSSYTAISANVKSAIESDIPNLTLGLTGYIL